MVFAHKSGFSVWIYSVITNQAFALPVMYIEELASRQGDWAGKALQSKCRRVLVVAAAASAIALPCSISAVADCFCQKKLSVHR